MSTLSNSSMHMVASILHDIKHSTDRPLYPNIAQTITDPPPKFRRAGTLWDIVDHTNTFGYSRGLPNLFFISSLNIIWWNSCLQNCGFSTNQNQALIWFGFSVGLRISRSALNISTFRFSCSIWQNLFLVTLGITYCLISAQLFSLITDRRRTVRLCESSIENFFALRFKTP